MTKILLLICTYFFGTAVFGQLKTNNVTNPLTNDSTYEYKYLTELAKKLKLQSLGLSSQPEYYRLWTDKQIIEIWQSQDGEYYSRLINWTKEYLNYKSKKEPRIYSQSYSISADTTLALINLITSSDILNIPTGDSIPGWNRGTDGTTYYVEYFTKKSYSLKSYWSPQSQDLVQQAKLVSTFFDRSFSSVNSTIIWQSFVNTLPFRCHVNGIGVSCKY